LFHGAPLWKCDFAEVNFGIQDECGSPVTAHSVHGQPGLAAVDRPFRPLVLQTGAAFGSSGETAVGPAAAGASLDPQRADADGATGVYLVVPAVRETESGSAGWFVQAAQGIHFTRHVAQRAKRIRRMDGRTTRHAGLLRP
jgi:hypothetical protein